MWVANIGGEGLSAKQF